MGKILPFKKSDPSDNKLDGLKKELLPFIFHTLNYDFKPTNQILKNLKDSIQEYSNIIKLPDKELSLLGIEVFFRKSLPLLRNLLGMANDPNICMPSDIDLHTIDFDNGTLAISVPIQANNRHLFWVTIVVSLGCRITAPTTAIPITIFTIDSEIRTVINRVMTNVTNNSKFLPAVYGIDESQYYHEYIINVDSSGPIDKWIATQFIFEFSKDTYKLLKGRFDG